jgi:hypothetical protein
VSPASRGLQAGSLLASLLALALLGERLASALLRGEAALSRAVAAVTLAFGTAILLATGLGHCGLLRPLWWFVALATLCAASLFVGAARDSAVPLDDAGADDVRPAPSGRVEGVLAALVLGSLAVVVTASASRFAYAPVGLPYDDASYHLTAVATWHHFGDLRMWKFGVGDGSTAFYPIGGELWTWTLLAPFRDSDVAARWAQLPFVLACLLAVASLARRLGISAAGCVLAVGLYSSIARVFPYLALSAGNDHSTAFFALAALDGAMGVWRRADWGRFVYTGVALGLLVGTKYLGLLHAATVGIVLAIGCLDLSVFDRARLRRLIGGLLLALLALAAAGGYTYLRNGISVGNPVFPLPVLGLPGNPGVSPGERLLEAESEIAPWRFLTERADLFGPLFVWTMLPAAILAPLLAAARWRPRETLLFALPAVMFLQFLVLTPDHRDLRYFLSGLCLAAIASAWLLERLPSRLAYMARAGLLAGMVWLFLSTLPWAHHDSRLSLTAGLAVLALAGWVGAAPANRRTWWLRACVLGVVGCSVAVPLWGRYVGTYQQRKLEYEPAVLALERLVADEGATVGYAGSNLPYLFFGRRLENLVTPVPHSGPVAARYFDWGDAGVFPFTRARVSRWLRNLRVLDIGFLVLIRSGEEEPERSWIENAPDVFRREYDDGQVEIFRVLQPSAEAAPAAECRTRFRAHSATIATSTRCPSLSGAGWSSATLTRSTRGSCGLPGS